MYLLRKLHAKTLYGVLLFTLASCSTPNALFDGGFETTDPATGMPQGWTMTGVNNNHSIVIDSILKHSGKRSLLIQYTGTDSSGGSGGGNFTVPVTFSGSEVTLSGYIKTENVEQGMAGLLMTITGAAGVMQFDNMQREGLHGTSDWKKYTIKLPLPKGARNIYVGGYKTGSGKVWLDDLKFLVDGKDVASAPKLVLNPAQQDQEFATGSNINIDSLTPQLLKDLEVLGKVWGFVKYYHPAVAEGKHNWDFELFRVLPEILQAGDIEKRNSVLYNWINRLGTVVAGTSPANMDTANIKLLPDLHWLDNKSELGDSLSILLKNIQSSRKSGTHFYVSFQPAGNADFGNESAYETMLYPDDGYRLLALFRYWNMVQYYFPYKYLIDGGWNKVLPEFIPAFLHAADSSEYQMAVLGLTTAIQDTHATLYGFYPGLQAYFGKYQIPANISFVEGKAIVKSLPPSTLLQPGGLQQGDVILKVNNEPVDSICKKWSPYIPASNYPMKLRGVAAQLLFSHDTTMIVDVERNGTQKTLKLKCFVPQTIYSSSVKSPKDSSWKILSKDIGYIYPGTIQSSGIPDMMKVLTRTRGIIIDLRCYPSEFIVYTLGKYFMPTPTDFVSFTHGSIIQPGLFEFNKTNNRVGQQDKYHYKGQIVILVNETTQSQAEFTAMAFRVAPGAIVMGSTTAGADGDVSNIVLPGGIRTGISGIGVYYPDRKETQQIGIVPDIKVSPSIKGVRANRDEVLEAAIALINKKR